MKISDCEILSSLASSATWNIIVCSLSRYCASPNLSHLSSSVIFATSIRLRYCSVLVCRKSETRSNFTKSGIQTRDGDHHPRGYCSFLPSYLRIHILRYNYLWYLASASVPAWFPSVPLYWNLGALYLFLPSLYTYPSFTVPCMSR